VPTVPPRLREGASPTPEKVPAPPEPAAGKATVANLPAPNTHVPEEAHEFDEDTEEDASWIDLEDFEDPGLSMEELEDFITA
jgi:hypothetical protein